MTEKTPGKIELLAEFKNFVVPYKLNDNNCGIMYSMPYWNALQVKDKAKIPEERDNFKQAYSVFRQEKNITKPQADKEADQMILFIEGANSPSERWQELNKVMSPSSYSGIL